jgi:hypothetical protein
MLELPWWICTIVFLDKMSLTYKIDDQKMDLGVFVLAVQKELLG